MTEANPDPSIFDLVREDLATHRGDWTAPGFHALAVYRFGRWAMARTGPIRKLARLVYFPAFTFVRNFYGIELPRDARWADDCTSVISTAYRSTPTASSATTSRFDTI